MRIIIEATPQEIAALMTEGRQVKIIDKTQAQKEIVSVIHEAIQKAIHDKP